MKIRCVNKNLVAEQRRTGAVVALLLVMPMPVVAADGAAVATLLWTVTFVTSYRRSRPVGSSHPTNAHPPRGKLQAGYGKFLGSPLVA